MMNDAKPRLADLVQFDDIDFTRNKRHYKQQALVSYAQAGRTLYFNDKMTQLLSISKWKAVLVGVDQKTKTVVMKCVPPDEYGAYPMRVPHSAKDDSTTNKRIVSVGDMVERIGINDNAHFRAEREGDMVYLQEASRKAEL